MCGHLDPDFKGPVRRWALIQQCLCAFDFPAWGGGGKSTLLENAYGPPPLSHTPWSVLKVNITTSICKDKKLLKLSGKVPVQIAQTSLILAYAGQMVWLPLGLCEKHTQRCPEPISLWKVTNPGGFRAKKVLKIVALLVMETQPHLSVCLSRMQAWN